MTQKSVFVATAVFLLGAVLAFLCWTGTGEELAPIGPNSAVPVGDVAPAEALVGDQLRGQPTDAAASPSDEAGPRAAVADVGTARPLPDDAAWVKITVVDKASGEPVPGASVQWYDETAHEHLKLDSDEWDEDTQMLWRMPEQLATRAGWSATADDKGVVRVTLREHSTVIGKHDGRFGQLQLRKNTVTPTGGHRLLLGPDRELRVRVVDDHDRPAAFVPITVLPFDAEGNPFGYFAWAAHARSDDDGMATIPHLQSLVDEAAQQDGGADQQDKKLTWRVRLHLPGDERKGELVDISSPPTEPLVLRLPTCGRVKVRAQLAGQPLAGFVMAWLSENTENRETQFDINSLQRASAEGVVLFRHVPIGRRYYVNAHQLGLGQEFAGPTVADQEVEVTLEPDAAAMLLRGRLLFEDRTPVATLPAQVEVRGPNVQTDQSFKTDAAGRFLVAVGSSGDDNKADTLTIKLVRKHQPPLQVEIPPRTLRAGIEDLGDLTLGTGPVVVAGRLLVGDAPFKGQIWLRVEKEQPGNGRRTPRWNGLDELQQWTDPQGVFSIHGVVAPGRYRLTFHTGETLPIPPVEFTPGTKDLVVRIETGSPLAASLLLPEKTPSELVSATLVPSTPPPPTPSKEKREPQLQTQPQLQAGERHDLQWPAVPAGSYALELRVMTQTEPLLRIADVLAPPPEGGDPRLVDIDLRGLVRRVHLNLIGPDGKPLDDAYGVAFPLGQAEQSEWVGAQFYRQPCELLVPPGPIELLVGVQGYRPQRVACFGERVDVRLDPWPTIELVVPGVPKLPEDVSVSISLVPVQGGGDAQPRFKTQWDSGERSQWLSVPRHAESLEQGKATLPIGDGAYRIDLSMRGNRRYHQLQGLEPAQVMATTGSVVVQVPAAQWQKALEVVTKPAAKK